jgi:putative transposase
MPRIVVPGQSLHVIQRGNNRQPVFYRDEDYHVYLETLQQAAVSHGCAIHAYVLMGNHVHLLLTPDNSKGPSRLMQAIGRCYVRYVNKKYRRTGTLWEGRFKSALIDSERYLLTCARYIELNPVRAGIVEHPGDYRWSSYRCNAIGQNDVVVVPHPMYEQLGFNTAKRRSVYRALFANNIDNSELESIRNGTRAGDVVGNDKFQKRIQALIGRCVKRYPHGGDRKSARFHDNGDEQ